MLFTFFLSLGGLLQGLDDHGSTRGNDGHNSLSDLDLQLYGKCEDLPVSGVLGDIVTNLLGGPTLRVREVVALTSPPILFYKFMACMKTTCR